MKIHNLDELIGPNFCLTSEEVYHLKKKKKQNHSFNWQIKSQKHFTQHLLQKLQAGSEKLKEWKKAQLPLTSLFNKRMSRGRALFFTRKDQNIRQCMTFTEQSVFMQSAVYKQTLLVQNGSTVRCMAHVLQGVTRREAGKKISPGERVGRAQKWQVVGGSMTVGLSKRGGHNTREKIFKLHPLQALGVSRHLILKCRGEKPGRRIFYSSKLQFKKSSSNIFLVPSHLTSIQESNTARIDQRLPQKTDHSNFLRT